MSNLNLAFYTYFFGTNNNPAFAIPDVPSEKYKCYYFTNNKTIIRKKETQTSREEGKTTNNHQTARKYVFWI